MPNPAWLISDVSQENVPALTAIDQERIARLVPPLVAILEEELRGGNQVVETWEGWPKKESLFVMLGAPFAKRYMKEGVTFLAVEDPHYWKEEYSAAEHSLGCRFS